MFFSPVEFISEGRDRFPCSGTRLNLYTYSTLLNTNATPHTIKRTYDAILLVRAEIATGCQGSKKYSIVPALLSRKELFQLRFVRDPQVESNLPGTA